MTIKTASGVELEPYQVVIRPLVTEKGTWMSERHNMYTFEVSPLASKQDIKQAVEELWNVHVVNVRTQRRKGKPRRHRFQQGRTKDWKKAIVELHEEHRIAFF